jgi:peptidoglycan/xylan/chitin deacetylase (PgdA/CDA1 family)
MAARKTSGSERPDPGHAQRLARRAARRRQIRRRRLLASSATITACVAVVAAVALSGGGSDSGSKSASGDPRAAGSGSGGGGRSTEAGLVRNATPQSDWEAHTGPVPILEYHELGEAPADAPYPELYVSRPDFHQQLEWLDDQGYEAVTLEEVEAAWSDGGTLPSKPVVLSFDDGYRPQYTFALPQLREHGWPGVLNLKAEGSDLYESNVRAMLAAGWELAAHTIHHLDLTELDAATLIQEVSGSRRMLRREFGAPVKDFCYPAGEFDEAVIAAVQAAGYSGATTEIPGYAEAGSPYELDRFEILGSSGVAGLAADLASGPA